VRRAIDIHKGQEVGEAAFTALVREAIALNSSRKRSKPSKKAKSIRARTGSAERTVKKA
jgi:hypothetical protein